MVCEIDDGIIDDHFSSADIFRFLRLYFSPQIFSLRYFLSMVIISLRIIGDIFAASADYRTDALQVESFRRNIFFSHFLLMWLMTRNIDKHYAIFCSWWCRWYYVYVRRLHGRPPAICSFSKHRWWFSERVICAFSFCICEHFRKMMRDDADYVGWWPLRCAVLTLSLMTFQPRVSLTFAWPTFRPMQPLMPPTPTFITVDENIDFAFSMC